MRDMSIRLAASFELNSVPCRCGTCWNCTGVGEDLPFDWRPCQWIVTEDATPAEVRDAVAFMFRHSPSLLKSGLKGTIGALRNGGVTAPLGIKNMAGFPVSLRVSRED